MRRTPPVLSSAKRIRRAKWETAIQGADHRPSGGAGLHKYCDQTGWDELGGDVLAADFEFPRDFHVVPRQELFVEGKVSGSVYIDLFLRQGSRITDGEHPVGGRVWLALDDQRHHIGGRLEDLIGRRLSLQGGPVDLAWGQLDGVGPAIAVRRSVWKRVGASGR